jgi:hypothetical protein
MGAKGEALARQFEAKVKDASALLGTLSAADWKKTTQSEKWTVGVTAHHAAGALEAVAGMVTAVASGHSLGDLTMGMIDGMNARHAQDHASCTKEETAALLDRSAAAAAAALRSLSDEQLAKSVTVFTDAPPMTVEQLVHGGLISHIDEHFGSIRKTVGR